MLSSFCSKVGRCGGAAIFAMLKFQLLTLQIHPMSKFLFLHISFNSRYLVQLYLHISVALPSTCARVSCVVTSSRAVTRERADLHKSRPVPYSRCRISFPIGFLSHPNFVRSFLSVNGSAFPLHLQCVLAAIWCHQPPGLEARRPLTLSQQWQWTPATAVPESSLDSSHRPLGV